MNIRLLPRLLPATLTLALLSLAAPVFAAVSLSPADIDWSTQANGNVRFSLRFRNPGPGASMPVNGKLQGQRYGAFAPLEGPLANYNVPPIAAGSFFDVFVEIPLSALPPSAEERHPPVASGALPETNPPCPPDNHWDGNVDIQWAGPGGTGHVNRHFGTIQVCPGAGNSYIHTLVFCGGTSNWTGWICIGANATVAIGATCCPTVTFFCQGQPGVIELCATACNCRPKAPQPTIGLIDWTNTPNQSVRFRVRWVNPDPIQASDFVQGQMASQEFGVFLPNFGPIGSFNVPPIPPASFFDVFLEVPLSALPPSAEKRRPGSLASGASIETNPRCPPDSDWDGNVDIQWTTSKQPGHVNYHFGTLQVCPGASPSYIHIRTINCPGAVGATWSTKALCPGFTATVVNQDFTPAPNPVPSGFQGWICVQADPTVALGDSCCLKVNWDCAGNPAEIVVCAKACDWSPKPSQPVPGTIDWVSTTGPAGPSVRFHVRWANPSPTTMTDPASGRMHAQELGVFLPDQGLIGNFNLPPIPPSSFFDVFLEVPLAALPPSAEVRLPGGTVAAAMSPETNPRCPDQGWHGNVHIVWNTPKQPGDVGYHFGTLPVCPGQGPSYIHIKALLCPTPPGATWSVKGLCPGFTATVVNQDFTPAPAVLPSGFQGWICVQAAAGVAFGDSCCLKVNFNCGGGLGEVNVCAKACDWSPKPSQPTPGTIDWWTVEAPGTPPKVRFHVRWDNPTDIQSDPLTGQMNSQPFGVFAQDYGTIGTFDVPPMQPHSFFDVFFEVPLSSLPPRPQKFHPPGLQEQGPENNSPCPRDNHWDGNVDISWHTPKMPGQVGKHFGTLQVCPGSGNSYIHTLVFCPAAATWSITGLCPGFTATLVNEDFSPAPNPVPAGWTGFICIQANTTVAFGTTCCPRVTFFCNGAPGVIELCATACNCAKVGVGDGTSTGEFSIRAAIPNPTMGSTTMSYELPRSGRVKFEIFDATGRRVRMLLDEAMGPGLHAVVWDGRGERGRVLVPGTYMARLSWQGRMATRKVLLLH